MAGKQTAVTTLTLLNVSNRRDFPPDISRLLDILVCIECRRQERLRSMRAGETANSR